MKKVIEIIKSSDELDKKGKAKKKKKKKKEKKKKKKKRNKTTRLWVKVLKMHRIKKNYILFSKYKMFEITEETLEK